MKDCNWTFVQMFIQFPLGESASGFQILCGIPGLNGNRFLESDSYSNVISSTSTE